MTYFGDREVRSRGAFLAFGSKYVAADPNAASTPYIQSSTATVAATNSTSSVTFPTAFSATPIVVTQNSNSAADATATILRVARSDTSSTGFTMKTNNTATNILTYSWFAHGLK